MKAQTLIFKVVGVSANKYNGNRSAPYLVHTHLVGKDKPSKKK